MEATIGFGYGIELGDVFEQLLVGLNGKLMLGRPFEKLVYIRDGDSAWEDLLTDFEATFNSDALTQVDFPFDIGLTLVMIDGRLRLSVVGKNLTEPKFKYKSGDSYQVRASYRAGFAFDIIKHFYDDCMVRSFEIPTLEMV